MRKSLLFLFLFVAALTARADDDPNWRTPVAPFQIADNLYYVGSRDLASYLVTTPEGDILINSNLESSPAQIRASVEKLGFNWTDVKILLISHAHFDHAAGSAEVLRETHAKYMVMDGDVKAIEAGGANHTGTLNTTFPPAHVDRVLHDGDTVALGGVTLVAHKTAGHTPGCTTWTMHVTQHGRPRDVVIVGSWNVLPMYRLVDRPGRPATYPGIARDYERQFRTLRSLPCDIFLASHGSIFDMLAKLDRAKTLANDPHAKPDAAESVWIDPAGYRANVSAKENEFHEELEKQERRK